MKISAILTTIALTLSFLSEPIACDNVPAPLCVLNSDIYPNALDIVWSAVNPTEGTVKSYEILYTDSTGDQQGTIDTSSNKTKFQLDGLKVCTRYTLQVRAKVELPDGSTVSGELNEISLTTFAAVPSPITRASVTSGNANMIFVDIIQMTLLPCESIAYYVEALDENNEVVSSTTSNSKYVFLQGLSPSTEYQVTVRKVDTNSKLMSSPYSRKITTTPAKNPCSKEYKMNLQIIKTTPNSIDFSWTPYVPKGRVMIDSLKLYYNHPSGESFEELNRQASTYTFEVKQPCASYGFRLVYTLFEKNKYTVCNPESASFESSDTNCI